MRHYNTFTILITLFISTSVWAQPRFNSIKNNSPQYNNQSNIIFGAQRYIANTDLFKDRFTVTTDRNSNYYFTTTSETSDGLGKLLRQLGVDPNWSNRKWIYDIHLNNRDTVDVRGNIINYGSTIKIPLIALKNCNGYSKLRSNVIDYSSSQQTIKNIQQNETLTAQSPIDSIKKAEVQDITYSSTPEASTAPPISPNINVTENTANDSQLKIMGWAGVGWNQANNKDEPSGTTTQLNTDLAYNFGGALAYKFTNNLYTLFYASGNISAFKDPTNLLVQQNEDLFITYGAELGKVLSNFSIGLFVESAQSPRSQLISSTTINVSTESAINVGLNLSIPFELKSKSVIVASIRPYFINSVTVDSNEYDSGAGVKLDLTYNFYQSKFFTNLNVNYEQQDYPGATNNLVESYLNLGLNFL